MRAIIKMSKYISVTTFFALMAILNIGALSPTVSAEPCQPSQSILGFPTWYEHLEGEVVQGKCRPIINASKDTLPIGLAIFEIALTLAGLVAVAMVFVGSFKFVLAIGESEKASAARKTVTNALIGLVITLVAVRAVSFVAERIY